MIDERNLLERDLRGQTRVLKRLAQGASLDEILHTLVEVAEETRPEMIGSILLLDEETGCLRNGASRRLPDFYCEAVDGVQPGPNVGSCGTAAFTGKRVVVEDIRTDPLWEGVRDIALRASLQACWSEPILGSTGEVLGTFAMYYQTPRIPDESELEFVSSSANLAALAIERVRYQQKVERERAVLRRIVDGIPDALLLASTDRKITHVNQGACRVFGYSAEELIGQTTSILYADPDDYHRQGDERFRVDSSQKREITEITEIEWRRKSGQTFPGEIRGAIVWDAHGKPLGSLGLIRDITDRKLAESQLADSQSKLVQAERLAAMGQMVSAIAHESRNALQRIQVGVDMLRYEIDEGTEAREDLERISRANQDLLHLHDELRSFAGPIQLDVSKGEVSEVWRQAWSNLQVSRAGRDAQMGEEIDGVDLTCSFDSFRLEQVFRNLFENSLAACDDPVRISVACRNSEIAGEPALAISVRDNGPGLSAELRARVFEAFYTTKAKGTGLGMAIARRFLEAHHGSIEVGNDADGGAEFLITLPRKSQ